MSKQIARLLKTDMMGDLDLKSLAQLLRSRGRGNDKILAHITAREAKRLKDEGGSGTINPDTGLPEYEDSFEDYPSIEMAQQAETQQTPIDIVSPPPVARVEAPAPFYQDAMPATTYAEAAAPVAPTRSMAAAPAVAPSYSTAPYATTPEGMAAEGRDITEARISPPGPGVKPEKPGFLQSLTTDQMIRLGLGAGTGLIGAQAARQAAEQAKQAKGEISALGAPYQQAGKSMQDAALRGELTPAGQQQVAAARAQLAQGIEKRGGVGAAQAATQLAQFRQNLLDQQYNYGLKVAQIGDSYAQKAIQTGLTQDKELVALMQGLTGAFGGFLGNQPNQPATSTPPRA